MDSFSSFKIAMPYVSLRHTEVQRFEVAVVLFTRLPNGTATSRSFVMIDDGVDSAKLHMLNFQNRKIESTK